MNFSPQSVKTFRFTKYEFDTLTGLLKLHYAFDNEWFFTEEMVFLGIERPLPPIKKQALDRVFHHLHLVAGISYYKAALPQKISIETKPINEKTANFLNDLYFHGLGEFAYQNNLDLRGRIKFPFINQDVNSSQTHHQLSRQTIVPIGGGKDSIVTIEALRYANESFRLFSVGNPRIIQNVATISGIPHISIQRRLSPQLIDLNKKGAFNGHVPISAIIAYILAASAILYGFDTVVMSNERSANVGNLFKDDIEINHQYSKSLQFEKDVAEQFADLLPGFRYFSLLRPLSELEITRLFSHFKNYHHIFSSCNRNFTHAISNNVHGNWCLNCPKCRFVFLALAPFVEKQHLLQIFGKNLLNDKNQQDGFDGLIGYHAHKPFECVGETEESLVAFYLLTLKKEWQKDILVQRFQQVILPRIRHPKHLIKPIFENSQHHEIPHEFEHALAQFRKHYKGVS
jgi:UDP-N-acetyl-alpha-D-muramoyl-L-alanyl-L-glutamate epimerase